MVSELHEVQLVAPTQVLARGLIPLQQTERQAPPQPRKRSRVISSIEDIIAVELVGEANNTSNNYHLEEEIKRHIKQWRAKPGFLLTPIN